MSSCPTCPLAQRPTSHDFKIRSPLLHYHGRTCLPNLGLIFFLLSISKGSRSKVPCHEWQARSSLSIQLIPTKAVVTLRQTDDQVKSWVLSGTSLGTGEVLSIRDSSCGDPWWASHIQGQVWSQGFFSRSVSHCSCQVLNSLPWEHLNVCVSFSEPWGLGHYKLMHHRTFKDMSISKGSG